MKQATFKKFWNSFFEWLVGIKQTSFTVVYHDVRNKKREFGPYPYWKARASQHIICFGDDWADTGLREANTDAQN